MSFRRRPHGQRYRLPLACARLPAQPADERRTGKNPLTRIGALLSHGLLDLRPADRRYPEREMHRHLRPHVLPDVEVSCYNVIAEVNISIFEPKLK